MRASVPSAMQPVEPIHKQLADGTHVWLRAVRPEDRGLLAQGFEEFGEDSRYRRFLMRKDSLSETDLAYLTNIDGVHHFAVGAVTKSEDGHEIPLGVARYVVFEDEPETAEAAIAVIDAMQGKGIGKLLIHELGELAYLNGVRRFRCSVLADNDASQKVLMELDPHARVVHNEANVKELELRLSPPPEAGPARQTLVERLLRLAAERSISMRGLKLKREGADGATPAATVRDTDAPATRDSASRSRRSRRGAAENPKVRER